MQANYALLLAAAAFAADRHRDQRRKDQVASPYINHPLALACVLANEGGVEDVVVLCAALLHDTLEDTATHFDELQQRFGQEVAAVVAEVSDDRSLSATERKQAQVAHAASISKRAKLVKLADKICNLRDLIYAPPASWDNARKLAYFDWSAQVVAGLRGVNPVLEGLFDETYQKGKDGLLPV